MEIDSVSNHYLGSLHHIYDDTDIVPNQPLAYKPDTRLLMIDQQNSKTCLNEPPMVLVKHGHSKQVVYLQRCTCFINIRNHETEICLQRHSSYRGGRKVLLH